MALVTYPLNNIEYSAEDAELFHVTRTSGIHANNSFDYSITGTDNNIVIGTGIGWIKNSEFSGKVIAQKEAISLNMGLPDPVYPRIDAIVIQFDNNRNETNIVVKKGTAESNPVAPSVVQNESVYELHLYHVRREAGSLYITPGNIADLRLNSSYCGLMADSITNIDTTAIERQVADLIESLQNEISNVIDGSAYLLRDGSTNMIGNLPMDGHKVTRLGTPTANDDAVPLGYANQNFAPAGYGLGESVGMTLTSADNCNNAFRNGWYNVVGAANAASQYNHVMLVLSYDSTAVHQIAFLGNADSVMTYIKIRKCYGSAWNEWEYLNPACSVGVEYRTTERIDGKAVYKKNVNGVIQYRLDGETTWHNYSDAVGAAPSGLNAEAIQSVTSTEQLDSVLATTYNSMADYSVKFKTIAVNAGGLPLGGGGWQFIINRTFGTYGIIYGVSYNQGGGFVFRVLHGGTWGSWQRFYHTDFAPAGYKTKLWENANISNAFNAQTISVDLSQYDGVEILYYVDSTTNIYQSTGFIKKGLPGVMYYVTADAGNRLHRTFTVNTNGIVFDTATASSGANVSTLCKPYQIIGIKGVK